MHAVHVKKSGGRVVVPDFLHAYAMVDGQPWDCRGPRAEEAVLADFARFLEILIKEDDERMDVEYRDYDDARCFVDSAGCNPGGAEQALRDAVEPLGLDADIVRMTLRELKDLAAEGEGIEFSEDGFCM
jgi:hypothetical protein